MAAGLSPKEEQQLMAEIFSPEIADNPYNFVMFAFPWGKKGTPLEKFPGPRKWQKKILLEMAEHIAENKRRVATGGEPTVYRLAVASGRGIGKSSLVAWLDVWMMSCHLGSTTIITANTEAQLKDKTMAELGKWHTLAINSHWFEKTALSLKPAKWFEEIVKMQLQIDTAYYYAQAQLWSEDNPDAFAGAHNYNGILLVFDEASGIAAPIWSVSEGFFTEPTIYRFWVVFSNPRRNTGAFFECFHKMRDFWRRRNIDSREVEGTDKAVYDQIIKQYGEDSDEARKEVKGTFPRTGERQFISRDLVDEAIARELVTDDHAALVMGIDPARFGDDSTVIRYRRGRDARSIKPDVLKGKDNMFVANFVAKRIEELDPDGVCCDAGNGTGIIDRLREMGYKVHEVWFGSKSDKDEYANKRTELWAELRDWLPGGCIDNSPELADDLPGPEYDFRGADGDKIILEPKEKMKNRGLASPDHGDALACTFAKKFARKDRHASRANNRSRIAKGLDYKILG